ncbi:hypothetical protein G9A89_022985 [Geosiphon pyriformis]|nr:hypothetical protein G9A89_022985 [Geosiphon pyriformis]
MLASFARTASFWIFMVLAVDTSLLLANVAGRQTRINDQVSDHINDSVNDRVNEQVIDQVNDQAIDQVNDHIND